MFELLQNSGELGQINQNFDNFYSESRHFRADNWPEFGNQPYLKYAISYN